jgi:hypothetical protein
VSSDTCDHRSIREAEQRVCEQEARVRRMVLSGFPTQAEEDRLRELERALALLKQASPPMPRPPEGAAA